MKKLIGLSLGLVIALFPAAGVDAETLVELSERARAQECLNDWAGLNVTGFGEG